MFNQNYLLLVFKLVKALVGVLDQLAIQRLVVVLVLEVKLALVVQVSQAILKYEYLLRFLDDLHVPIQLGQVSHQLFQSFLVLLENN